MLQKIEQMNIMCYDYKRIINSEFKGWYSYKYGSKYGSYNGLIWYSNKYGY